MKRSETLVTVDSPDLEQAESTLITDAGLLRLITKVLTRIRGVHFSQGITQKDPEQAIPDQQGTEAIYTAAMDAVRIFGKKQAEIDRIVASHQIDFPLIVPSPIAGGLQRVFDHVSAMGQESHETTILQPTIGERQSVEHADCALRRVERKPRCSFDRLGLGQSEALPGSGCM